MNVCIALSVFERFKRTLALELDGEPDAATQQLIGHIRGGQVSFETAPSQAKSLDIPHPTMPLSATHFVGREAEIRKVIAQLSDPACRLLTLVAPGGMGKTRLALEVAGRLSPSLEDGACFIPFEAVSAPELMVPATAEALGFSFSGQKHPRDELLTYLETKQMLLVVDNLEHLLADMSLMTDLLANAPKLKLLATSRESLNLHAEWLFDLMGMRLPDAHTEEAHEVDSVKLFVQSAKQARASFALGPNNLDAVTRLCRQVGGMPLALELAASWLRILSPQEVLAELEKDISILQTFASDLPKRHLDIQEVFEASWLRLPAGAQAALRQLAVFEGGFTIEAAREVAEVGLPLLLLLINKSFLRQDGSRRFTPHPLMWQFVRQKAEDAATKTTSRERHAHYFLVFAQERTWAHRGEEAKQARAEINLELPNIRLAWDFATDTLREDLLGLANLSLFFHFLTESRFAEGAALFKVASESLGSESLVHARVLHHYGAMLNLTGRFEDSRADLERSLAIKRRHHATWDIAQSLVSLGFNYIFSDYVTREKQAELWRECAELFAASGDKALQGRALSHLAEHLTVPVERAHLLQDSLSILRVEQSYHELSNTLARLAKHTARTEGNFEEATLFADEAVTLERQKGNVFNLFNRLGIKGHSLLYQGKLEEAEECFLEVLTIASQKALWSRVIASLGTLACVNALQGQNVKAQDHLERALELSKNPDGDNFWSLRLLTLEVFSHLSLVNKPATYSLRQFERVMKRLGQTKNESVDIAWSKVQRFNAYGKLMLGQGSAVAKPFFVQALQLATTWHFRPALLHVLPSFAMLHLQKDEVAHAHRLLTLVLDDPASMFQTKVVAKDVLKDLRPSLTESEFEAKQEMVLEKAVEDLLNH